MRHDLGALGSMPQAVELPLDGAALGGIETVWRELSPLYDWNPSRIVLRDARRYRLARFGGFVVLSCPSALAATSALLLCGRGDAADLRSAMRDRPLLRSDRQTAEHALSVGAEAGVVAVHARHFDEYWYDLAEQHAMCGNKFSRRRTYLRALERSGAMRFEKLSLACTADVDEIRHVTAQWQDRQAQAPTVDDERAALERLLSGSMPLDDMHVAGLRVNDELAGFAIYDTITDDAATAHFVKARRNSAEIAGTWQALFDSAYRAGARVLNGGYDGGLEGLRRAKSGLRPHSIRQAFFVLPG